MVVREDKPAGVPEENGLPVNRKDENMDIILRVYVPDLEKMKTWTARRTQEFWRPLKSRAAVERI